MSNRAEASRVREAAKTAAFLEDYNHLRDFGWPHERIAAKFGVELDSLNRRLERHGVRRPEPAEKVAQTVLERLIAERRQITVNHLPSMFDEDVAKAVVDRAAKSGRIRKVGTRPHLIPRHSDVAVYEVAA